MAPSASNNRAIALVLSCILGAVGFWLMHDDSAVHQTERTASVNRAASAVTSNERPQQAQQQPAAGGSAAVVPQQAAAQQVAPAAACDPFTTAAINCKTGKPRKFLATQCRRSFTIAELQPDFMAHQVEWAIMGRNSAFWSVLTGMPRDDELIMANANMTNEFYESGMLDVAGIHTRMDGSKVGVSSANIKGDVLDFGCGLGRLGFALARQPKVRAVTCVEQSVFHMLKTNRFAEKMPLTARFSALASGPDLLMSLQRDDAIPKCYDFINSLIVFQHITTPLQTVYMEQLCDVLKPGGAMHFQIPFHVGEPQDGPSCTDEELAKWRSTGGMQMHATTMEGIRDALTRRGCVAEIHDMGEAWVGQNRKSALVMARKRTDWPTPCVAE